MSIALYCVLVAGLLPILTVGFAKARPGYDNRSPRAWAGTLEGRAERAYAAHQNAYEAFPLFAVAVLVAEWRAGGGSAVDVMALGFVLARIGYAAAYITDRPSARSLLWLLGWSLSLAIFLTPAFA